LACGSAEFDAPITANPAIAAPAIAAVFAASLDGGAGSVASPRVFGSAPGGGGALTAGRGKPAVSVVIVPIGAESRASVESFTDGRASLGAVEDAAGLEISTAAICGLDAGGATCVTAVGGETGGVEAGGAVLFGARAMIGPYWVVQIEC